MCIRTKNQVFSERAWGHVTEKAADEFITTARSFPALVHSSGAAQAIAFLLSKNQNGYLDALAAVMGKDRNQLHSLVQDCPLSSYLALTREIMRAAQWIKRTTDAKNPY